MATRANDRITHRIAYFDDNGKPISSTNVRADSLDSAKDYAKKHATKRVHRIHILNDVEGNARRGTLVANLSRGADGAFHQRYGTPQPKTHDKQGHGLKGNPTKGHEAPAGAKGLLTAAMGASSRMGDAAKKLR